MRCNWHRIGATVIVTASSDDESYLKSIGASRVIDYREAQFEKVLQEKVDVVFDCVGGDTQKRSFLVLKEGGHLVSAVQPVSQEETAKHRVSGEMMRLAPSGDVVGRIARLLEEGAIRSDVATVYALQDAARPGGTSPGTCLGFMGCRPVGREPQDASTARSCFVWPSSEWDRPKAFVVTVLWFLRVTIAVTGLKRCKSQQLNRRRRGVLEAKVLGEGKEIIRILQHIDLVDPQSCRSLR